MRARCHSPRAAAAVDGGEDTEHACRLAGAEGDGAEDLHEPKDRDPAGGVGVTVLIEAAVGTGSSSNVAAIVQLLFCVPGTAIFMQEGGVSPEATPVFPASPAAWISEDCCTRT